VKPTESSGKDPRALLKGMVPYMKWLGLNELREIYLSFFESKGHLRMPSAPLLPADDKSLLLINAGMAPFKKYFSGQAEPPCRRLTSCQKCVRVNDIENVGITARHGTYFEMLGNFSFGDYFKQDSLNWSWEFCTKVLEMPPEKLWATIYTEDDEAFDIWTKEIGMPADHIVRLGKDDNFWEIGSGPCGPCSEIYYDRGPEYGCGSPDCKPGCDCDRYMEFWNNVFTQFDSDGNGHYSELEHKNIDTGMGLERIACIFQGVNSLFEVDTVRKILDHICHVADVKYKDNAKKDISIRVITDHIRATTFLICDGVLPSNEGRGYVLRRLLRRAARHGRLLGINKPFLSEICDTVVAENKGAYPELVTQAAFIKRVITEEEKRFNATIDSGSQMLDELLSELEKAGKTVLDGADAFKLYDTFGFPIDLTREIAEERNITIDMDSFKTLMDKQRETARSARTNSAILGWETNETVAAQPTTKFIGYSQIETDCNILVLIGDADAVSAAMEGEKCVVICDESPFYGESGGQVGSRGTITQDGGVFEVTDTKKAPGGQLLHYGFVRSGMISAGKAHAQVDEKLIHATMRNHTSAHLLQAALRKVLGDHVHQAGQLVDERRMRFDFSHFSAVSEEELKKVEALINDAIFAALPVTVTEMPIDKAREIGAMALFGEKYGATVRVVVVKGFSTELCGGTHIDNTAKIGAFKIISESSVAAGVRRIEAVTGKNLLDYFTEKQNLLDSVSEQLKLKDSAGIPDKISHLLEESREQIQKFNKLRSAFAMMQIDSMLSGAAKVGDVTLVTARLEDSDAAMLQEMIEKLTDRSCDGKLVAVLAGIAEGKCLFAVGCSKKAVENGLKAGNIARSVAQVTGGNGGGRPDFAMAGAKDMALIDKALSQAKDIISAGK